MKKKHSGKSGKFSMFDNIYKNKTVLITGDTGFKGSWLAIWVKILGANVIGISLPPKTSHDNYIVCGLNDKIIHIDQDIREFDPLLEIFNKYKPEIVFHLAAQSLVLESYRNPLETYSTNLMGTVNVLEAIRHNKSIKVTIIITSDKCYENKEWVYSYRENDRMGGKDPYSSSKAACELAINSYIQSFFSKNNTVNIASVRAGNAIGGGDWAENRIVPDCIRALENDEPIIIRNHDAVRPWQHVLEPLDGYLTIASLLYSHGGEYVGPWNFGPSSKNMVTVKELVEEIINQWGSGEISYEDKKEEFSEAKLLHLDISKAVNQLKWQPKLNVIETVRYTIEEYKTSGMNIEDVYKQRIEHIKRYMKK